MNQRHWQEIEKIIDQILATEDPQAKNEILQKTYKDNPELYEEIKDFLKNIQEAEIENYLENQRSFLD